MLDLHIPRGALDPDLEAHLVARLTDALIELDGEDPTDPVLRALSWTFVHRPESVFVAGMPERLPHFRAIVSAPADHWDDADRAAVVRVVTETIMEIEREVRAPDADRIWVLFQEVADGAWGASGRIFRVEDVEALRAAGPRARRPLGVAA